MNQINFSTSFKDFLEISSDKNAIARILYNSIRNSSYYSDRGVFTIKEAYSLMLSTSEIDYITFRNDGTISYLPTGKEHVVNSSGDWSKDNRQNGKPSKVIRKLFTAKALSILKDKDFENFTNLYKNNFSNSEYKLEVLPASKIPTVYCMDRVESGSLGGSCMNDDSDYLEIYKKCAKLKIIALTNKSNQLCGRALLWQVDDNISFMDRVYVAHDFLYETFLDYAIKNNLWRKRDYKSYDNKTSLINPQGECIYKTLTIHTNTDCDYYPYIDTFSFGGDGYLCNDSSCCEYEYNDTGGSRSGGEDCEDDHENEIYIECGERRYYDEWYPAEDCVLVGNDWYHENDENIARCNGECYRIDSGDICEVNGEYELMDDCVYIEEIGEYILINDAIEIDNEWYENDSDSIVEVNDTWYLKTSDAIVEIDDTFYHKDDDVDSGIICEIDGGFYLTDNDIITTDSEGNYILRQLKLAI